LSEIALNSYAWSSPHGGCRLESIYSRYFRNLYGKKIIRERDLREKLSGDLVRPELMIMGNFVLDRAAIVSLCRDAGIETVHSEDGFFPHYGVIHADPLGFCWESSLPRMVFRRITEKQRKLARETRERWLEFQPEEMDRRVKKPFVLWPLQILGDTVNRRGLGVTHWGDLVTHFRRCLPEDFQLVLKLHPRSRTTDALGIAGLARLANSLPNTILLARSHPLKCLLQACSGAAGVNSTTLYEARLMFRKPVYVYGRSWFTNHEELFLPISERHIREPGRLDWLADNKSMRTQYREDYADWFLYQLLARQIDKRLAERSPKSFKAQEGAAWGRFTCGIRH
jgi:hypothetical protein